MKGLRVAVLVALCGSMILALLDGVLGPTPQPVIAVYNLWLLGTVVLVVIALLVACFRFFAYISGGH